MERTWYIKKKIICQYLINSIDYGLDQWFPPYRWSMDPWDPQVVFCEVNFNFCFLKTFGKTNFFVKKHEPKSKNS